MHRITTFAAVLFTAMASSAAVADVTITVGSDGYDDFFKRCDISVNPDGDPAPSMVTYFVDVGDKGVSLCQETRNGSACRETDDIEYTCDDVRGVEVIGVTCRGDDGRTIPCGTISAKADASVAVPVTGRSDGGGSSDGVEIYATILGYDDFFDRCEIGTSYAADAHVDKVEMVFETTVAKGISTASVTLSGSGGTGASFSGVDEYTCADVQSVKMTSLTCFSDDAEIDCGTVRLQTVGTDLITDGR